MATSDCEGPTVVKRDRGPIYSVKANDGQYYCGPQNGYKRCRICAIRMMREEAHVHAHNISGRVVIIRRAGDS